MPELPEVETVRSALEPVLHGQQISSVRLTRQDLRWPLPRNLPEITHRPDMRPALAARQIYFDPPSAVRQNIAYPSGYVRGNKAVSAPAGAIWKT